MRTNFILGLLLFVATIATMLNSAECKKGKGPKGKDKGPKGRDRKSRKKFKLEPKKYLWDIGYSSDPEIETEDPILDYQDFFGLPLTGQLDYVTMRTMEQPRCGMTDPIERFKDKKYGKGKGPRRGRKGGKPKKYRIHRGKRFLQQGTSWLPLFEKTGENKLKWTLLSTGTQLLSREEVLVETRKAFQFWADVTNLIFEEVPLENVDKKYAKDDIEILVSFGNEDHGDPYPFDGQGGTLAHAFYPLSNDGLSGDVHFDDDEDYTIQSEQGTNLLWVATHEIGHSLGLEHSNVNGALMYPVYTGYRPDFALNIDDILGIQSIYGIKETPTTTTITLPTTSTTTLPTTSTTTLPTTSTTTPTTSTTAPTTTTTATPITTTTNLPTTTTTLSTTTTPMPPMTTTTTTTTSTDPITTTTTTTTTPQTTTTTTTPPKTTTTPDPVPPVTKPKCPRSLRPHASYYNKNTQTINLFTRDRIITYHNDGRLTEGATFSPQEKRNFISHRMASTQIQYKGETVELRFVGRSYFIIKDSEKPVGPFTYHAMKKPKGHKGPKRRKGSKGHKKNSRKGKKEKKKPDSRLSNPLNIVLPRNHIVTAATVWKGGKLYLFATSRYYTHDLRKGKTHKKSHTLKHLVKRYRLKSINAAFWNEKKGHLVLFSRSSNYFYILHDRPKKRQKRVERKPLHKELRKIPENKRYCRL
ncbi:uncharacterized protein [Clytia hemisphaerica]